MSQAKETAEKTDSKPQPPGKLRGNNLTARILRQKIWRPTNVGNDWRVFCIVGREGSGKSHTALSILEKVDPSFNAERVFFDPEDLLRYINSVPKDERQGKGILLDEAGVGMGVRTWYDEDQINLNKVLQTARDDNMIVGMTLPRLEELDSQMEGRLHIYIEMTKVEPGEYAKFKFMNVNPSRGGEGEIYKWYPRMRFHGRRRRVSRCSMGPPAETVIEKYEERKSEFKADLYEDTLEGMEDESDDDWDAKSAANDILDKDAVDEYIQTANNGKYIDKDLIALNYDLGTNHARTAKKKLLQEVDNDDLM